MTSITTLSKNVWSELLFADTDSLNHWIKSEDVYEELLFDLSNFSKDSKFYDNQNEMVVGYMKGEYKGIPINKFVGLKSKMHFLLSDDGRESNKAKGANVSTEFKEYEDTLINKKVIRHKIRRIQSKKKKLEHRTSSIYHYRVLMIKYSF